MIKDRVVGLLERLTRVITEPRSELTRWQKALRYLYDVARYGAVSSAVRHVQPREAITTATERQTCVESSVT